MNKQEYIQYWKDESEESWRFGQKCIASKDWVYALFYFHLSLEKLAKALWVKDNIDDLPPCSHDLQYLLNQTTLELDAEQYAYLAIVNSWNLESRYPDYKRKIYQRTTESFAKEQEWKVNELRQFIRNKL